MAFGYIYDNICVQYTMLVSLQQDSISTHKKTKKIGNTIKFNPIHWYMYMDKVK